MDEVQRYQEIEHIVAKISIMVGGTFLAIFSVFAIIFLYQ